MVLETKSRIFEPFFTTKLAGRGLGLPAARSIVQAHKGAIRVYSAPGQGSTFKVLLPATGEEAVPRHPAPKSREPMGREAVLIVDDEEIVRHTAKAALERYGYHPGIATNGQDAIRIYAKRGQEIALVLLDLTMPGLTGEETAKELLRVNPDCNILLSSGYNESEATRNLGSIRICGFLQKPYTAATFAEKVRQCLHPSPPASGDAAPPEARHGDA
jgi:CheY-like chemotaxis protein